jgi:phage repressor protein C with HTH and peptisase S24 domain
VRHATDNEPNRIRHWRGHRRITLAELARRVGTSAQMGRLEAGTRRLTQDWMVRIAGALTVMPQDLLLESQVTPPAGDAKGAPLEMLPAGLGARDLPVYASAQGGPTGMLIDSHPTDWVLRPQPLMRVQKAFAVYVVGDSMEPVYEPGDLLLIHPGLPPTRGRDVLLTAQRSDGEAAALVKRLVQATATDWIVRQYNPPAEFPLPRSEWQTAFVIVGKYHSKLT